MAKTPKDIILLLAHAKHIVIVCEKQINKGTYTLVSINNIPVWVISAAQHIETHVKNATQEWMEEQFLIPPNMNDERLFQNVYQRLFACMSGYVAAVADMVHINPDNDHPKIFRALQMACDAKTGKYTATIGFDSAPMKTISQTGWDAMVQKQLLIFVVPDNNITAYDPALFEQPSIPLHL